jgi:CRISPR/Cas system-associated exonuclease Cas4 (RecB family)
MPDHLSNSQISLYLQCSLKYKFNYIDELPKPFKPAGLAWGSVIHSALSWFHKQRMAGKPVTLEKLYKIFEADWYCQKVETEIRYREGEDEMKLVLLAKELLALYFHQGHNGAKGSEIPFVVPLVNLSNGEEMGINLEGFIDLLEEDDIIVEFKTSAQTMAPKDVEDLMQLTAYSYAFELLHKRPPKLIKLVNFVKAKKPKIIVHETHRSQEDYERLYHLARQVLKGIKEGIFFPRHSFWCKGCEYEAPCRAWGGN